MQERLTGLNVNVSHQTCVRPRTLPGAPRLRQRTAPAWKGLCGHPWVGSLLECRRRRRIDRPNLLRFMRGDPMLTFNH